EYKIKLANVFHAGDGNLHPLICFDLRRGDDLERVRQAGREIMETCVRAGGSITGEHGVGLDKSSYLPLIFSEDDMNVMLSVRAAFDPTGLCNPGKIIPIPGGCGEARAVATQQLSEPGAVATGPPLQSKTSPEHEDEDKGTIPGAFGGVIGKGLLAQRMNEARIKTDLSRIVGREGVQRLTEADITWSSSFDGYERALEVAPANSKQASQIMEFATQENMAIILAGAGTW